MCKRVRLISLSSCFSNKGSSRETGSTGQADNWSRRECDVRCILRKFVSLQWDRRGHQSRPVASNESEAAEPPGRHPSQKLHT